MLSSSPLVVLKRIRELLQRSVRQANGPANRRPIRYRLLDFDEDFSSASSR
jgi:hypothetical protein